MPATRQYAAPTPAPPAPVPVPVRTRQYFMPPTPQDAAPTRAPVPMVTPAPRAPRVPDVVVTDGVRCLSGQALSEATNGFSASRVIGSGGYGKVYAGTLRTSLLGTTGVGSTTTQVAIKILDPSGLQGQDQFQAEVSSLTLLRHPNIVPLFAICTGVFCFLNDWYFLLVFLFFGHYYPCMLPHDENFRPYLIP